MQISGHYRISIWLIVVVKFGIGSHIVLTVSVILFECFKVVHSYTSRPYSSYKIGMLQVSDFLRYVVHRHFKSIQIMHMYMVC